MDALAANGFGRRSLHMRAGHKFTLGASGVPIPDTPRQSDASWGVEVLRHYYNGLTDAQRAQPEWYPDNPANAEHYDAEFHRIHREQVNRWDGTGLAPMGRHNVEGRRAFWSMPGCTLPYVLAHMAGGDQPRLQTPVAATTWAPRRASTQESVSSSRSSSSSPNSSRSAPPQFRAPKPGTGTANRVYDSSGALVINNNGVPIRSASCRPPPSSAKKPKLEVKTEPSMLAELRAFQEAHATADDPEGLAPALEASRNTIPPPPPPERPDACAWSLKEHLAATGAPLIDLGNDDGFGPGANDHEAGSSKPPGGGDDAHRVKEENDVFWRYR